MWGSHLMHGPIEITCLVVGITSILAYRYLPDEIREEDRSKEPYEEALLARRGGTSAMEDQDQDHNYDR